MAWFELLTFSEFNALAARDVKASKQKLIGHAMTCATLANIHRGKQAKTWKPIDFVKLDD